MNNLQQFFVPTPKCPTIDLRPSDSDVNTLLGIRIKLEKAFPFIKWNIVLTDNEFFIEGEQDPVLKVTPETIRAGTQQIGHNMYALAQFINHHNLYIPTIHNSKV